MKLKDFILKRKNFLIAYSIALLLGISLGFATVPSKDELPEIEQTKIQLTQKKETLTKEYTKLEDDNSKLIKEKSKLQSKKNEKEKLAKLEEDRIAKEAANKKAAEKESAEKKKAEEAIVAKEYENQQPTNTNTSSETSSSYSNASSVSQEPTVTSTVWKTATGSKYHSKNNCGNTNPSKATEISINSAENMGLTPCSKCF